MRSICVAAAMMGLIAVPAAAAPKPVEVMVIGTYHFANHNRDLHNVRSDDVLDARRLKELSALTARLAVWKLTKIMVEVIPPKTGQRLTGSKGEFDRSLLSTSREKWAQIGYRLAAIVHAPVFAINEQPEGDDPDYFPFGKVEDFAKKHGLEAQLADLQGQAAESAAAVTKALSTSSIPSVLASLNTDAAVAQAHRPYVEMLRFGDVSDQPGAELYAYWMMRNAKIFGKAMLEAEPGDRVLIIYGAGHAYWLRHFASEVPGYRFASPVPILLRTSRSLGR